MITGKVTRQIASATGKTWVYVKVPGECYSHCVVLEDCTEAVAVEL